MASTIITFLNSYKYSFIGIFNVEYNRAGRVEKGSQKVGNKSLTGKSKQKGQKIVGL